jgi:hypothetical protein
MQLAEKNLEATLESFLESLVGACTPDRVFLWTLIVSGVVSIVLFQQGVLPLTLDYFLFYSVLLLLFALYRPLYAWGTLIFFLPFEVITVTTVEGAAFRPYQWLTIVLLLATLVLILQRKQTVPTIRWYDALLFLVVLGAVLGQIIFNSPGGLKNILVFFSFAGLYGLGRVFLVSQKTLHTTIKSFLASATVVAVYALCQSFLFEKGGEHFMVMPGRPNSTFTEADWLGFFLGAALLVTAVLFIKGYQEKDKVQLVLWTILETVFVMGAIVTVSRSAWLGILLGLTFFLGVLCVRSKKLFVQLTTTLVGVFFIAVTLVQVFHLSRFDLSQRLQSTATTEQTITIACKDNRSLPSQVATVEELLQYECRHIDLEVIPAERAAGSAIRTIGRPDPNITIRATIYQKTFEALRGHWFLGLGPGSSATLFGVDSRGASLNSSNMFLETWLVSGLIGFIGLSSFWFLTGALLMRSIIRRKTIGERWYILMGLLALWIHASTFNFFNSGLLLGEFSLLLIFLAWYLERKAPHIQNIWQR